MYSSVSTARLEMLQLPIVGSESGTFLLQTDFVEAIQSFSENFLKYSAEKLYMEGNPLFVDDCDNMKLFGTTADR